MVDFEFSAVISTCCMYVSCIFATSGLVLSFFPGYVVKVLLRKNVVIYGGCICIFLISSVQALNSNKLDNHARSFF